MPELKTHFKFIANQPKYPGDEDSDVIDRVKAKLIYDDDVKLSIGLPKGNEEITQAKLQEFMMVGVYMLKVIESDEILEETE